MYTAFTVHTTSGARYGADVIHSSARHEDGERVAMVQFMCSGEPTGIPAAEVEKIEVNEAESTVCMVCC